MKILILEDEQVRVDFISDKLMDGENILFHAKGVDTAYDALVAEGDIDVIMFDNDLGDGGEGKMLAQLIQRDSHTEDLDYVKNLKSAIVHSMNVVASKNIYDIMSDIVPFSFNVPFGSMLNDPMNLTAAINVAKAV